MVAAVPAAQLPSIETDQFGVRYVTTAKGNKVQPGPWVLQLRVHGQPVQHTGSAPSASLCTLCERPALRLSHVLGRWQWGRTIGGGCTSWTRTTTCTMTLAMQTSAGSRWELGARQPMPAACGTLPAPSRAPADMSCCSAAGDGTGQCVQHLLPEQRSAMGGPQVQVPWQIDRPGDCLCGCSCWHPLQVGLGPHAAALHVLSLGARASCAAALPLLCGRGMAAECWTLLCGLGKWPVTPIMACCPAAAACRHSGTNSPVAEGRALRLCCGVHCSAEMRPAGNYAGRPAGASMAP